MESLEGIVNVDIEALLMPTLGQKLVWWTHYCVRWGRIITVACYKVSPHQIKKEATLLETWSRYLELNTRVKIPSMYHHNHASAVMLVMFVCNENLILEFWRLDRIMKFKQEPGRTSDRMALNWSSTSLFICP